MVLREWMVTHEWMVKPMPQTEWIERRGILIWVAEVFTSLGAGLYLISLFYGCLRGMALALFMIVFLKLIPHLFYLGKPLRFWRIFPPFSNAWKTSWISRGILFTVLFSIFASVQIFLTRFYPGTEWETAFKFLGGVSAVLAGIYSGFAMSYCRSVPFWNSALLPLVFFFAGIADGLALVTAINVSNPLIDILAAESASRIILIVNALIIVTYLLNATYTSKTAKYSVMLLLRGSLALPFWVGLITLGVVVPLILSFIGLFSGETPGLLLIVAAVSHTIGAFTLKYCLLKAGVHSPVLPVTTSSYH